MSTTHSSARATKRPIAAATWVNRMTLKICMVPRGVREYRRERANGQPRGLRVSPLARIRRDRSAECDTLDDPLRCTDVELCRQRPLLAATNGAGDRTGDRCVWLAGMYPLRPCAGSASLGSEGMGRIW